MTGFNGRITRHRPPWWPADEPWPPRGRALRRERRLRWIRRSGWISFLPIWVLSWIALNSLRSGGLLSTGNRTAALLLAGAAIAGAVAIVLRYLAAPLADLASAADRVRSHDYKARVTEPGRGPAWIGDTARAFNAMASELESQDRARRNLMADIAHELRTPLAVLQGQIEGLIDGVYPRDEARLEKLLHETRTLGRLIEDLRSLATAESGALALTREPTDLVALVGDVLSSLETEAAGAGVALGEQHDDREVATLDVDPLRIREVLVNLVSNAVRHTPRGGQVRVTIADTPRQFEIRVVDTGTGMAPEELARVFDRFYKGSGSSGSGLGLTIARSLVQAHGGALRAESAVGRGTSMIITLPR